MVVALAVAVGVAVAVAEDMASVAMSMLAYVASAVPVAAVGVCGTTVFNGSEGWGTRQLLATS